jgi:hypothetical protein
MHSLGELPKASTGCTIPFTNFKMLILHLFDPTEYNLEERFRFWANLRPWFQQQATIFTYIRIRRTAPENIHTLRWCLRAVRNQLLKPSPQEQIIASRELSSRFLFDPMMFRSHPVARHVLYIEYTAHGS